MLTNGLIVAGGAALGAIVGSYLATALIRWPHGLSTRAGRSRCDSCGRTLPVGALVPILSWLIQRGRCRSCKAPIAADHPVMEFGALLVGAIAAALFGSAPWIALASAILGWGLLLLTALDLRHFWLPDRLTLPLCFAGLLVNLGGIGPGLQESVIGAIAGYASLRIIAAAYRQLRNRDGLGGGDPKLLGAIGAWLGWQALPAVVLIAALIGLAGALYQLAKGRKSVASAQIPLGALLALTAWPLWVAQLIA